MTIGGGASSRRDWAQLTDVLLHRIMPRITKLKDVVSFQTACKPWRQAAAVLAEENNQHPGKFRQSLPWLMRPCQSSDSHGPTCRHFIDVTTVGNNSGDVVSRHMKLAGDDPSASEHLSSTFGWLLRATKQLHSLYLFNPFTGNQIPLPTDLKIAGQERDEEKENSGHQYSKRRFNVITFAMSVEPTTKIEECVVMICYVIPSGDIRITPRRGLAFCKIGDQRWRLVPLATDAEQGAVQDIMDIVFWKGEFHALCRFGNILVCGKSGVSWAFRCRDDDPLAIRFRLEKLKRTNKYSYCLLVSPEEELVLVVRSWNKDGGKNSSRLYCSFQVYKIDGEMYWNEVAGIGDYALFLNNHKVTYVSVEDHPECKANCVYYPLGMFNLGTKVNELVFNFTRGGYDQTTCATWILPSNY